MIPGSPPLVAETRSCTITTPGQGPLPSGLATTASTKPSGVASSIRCTATPSLQKHTNKPAAPVCFVINTCRVPRGDLLDQRLCAENGREGEALGVFGLGFGGKDHDPQI